jgi:hypothetical protein
MDTQTTDEVVQEKEYDFAIVTDQGGNVIYNAAQADDPIIRRLYADGTFEILRKSTMKPILPRHHPDGELPRCPNCRHEL